MKWTPATYRYGLTQRWVLWEPSASWALERLREQREPSGTGESLLRYPAMQGLNLALFFLILDLSVSYFPFSGIFLLQNVRAQIWFLDPHEYCSHWLFHAYLALIQKEFDSFRNISHLEDKVSNWRSRDLQHLGGTGGETFGCVVPVAIAEPSHYRPCLSMQST